MIEERNCDIIFDSFAKDGRIDRDSIKKVFDKADISTADLDSLIAKALQILRQENPAYQNNEEMFDLGGWYLLITLVSEANKIESQTIIDAINAAF